MKPRLHVLVCSTRPGRACPAVARWALQAAQADGRFDAHLVDLAEFGLPVFDEPEHPRLGRYQHAHTRAWSASVAAADAFLFVMPEYNYGPTPSLLNAMNYLVREWQYKAVGFVSYGGMSGGVRGVQVTKQLLTTFKLVPILEAVAIPNFQQHLAGDTFIQEPIHASAADAMLGELHRWTEALAVLRNPEHEQEKS